MWNRLQYSRKLAGMAIIVLVLSTYFLNGGKSLWMVLGSFLLIEHYLIWDRWDFYDYLIGHEWWGLYLMIIVYLVNGFWWSILFTITGFLIGATYNKSNVFKEVIPTIKEIFK